jgi:hypothetical protein
VKALAINATQNTAGKSDATGAFVPEAIAFQKHWIAQGAACARFGYDNRRKPGEKRAEVETILSTQRGLDLIAFFGHGLRRSMQTGHDMASVGALATIITNASAPHVVVVLYACSTGATDTGFAAALRNELNARGKTGHVDSHANPGHTTQNPFVRRFVMGEREGHWIVEPQSPTWRSWRASLKGDMRFRFPTMADGSVHAEIDSRG